MGGSGTLNQSIADQSFLCLTCIVFPRTCVYVLSWCARWLPSCLPSSVPGSCFSECRCGGTLEVFVRTGPALIAWIAIVQFHAPPANPVGLCAVIPIVPHLVAPRLLFHWTLIFFLVPLLDLFTLIRPRLAAGLGSTFIYYPTKNVPSLAI